MKKIWLSLLLATVIIAPLAAQSAKTQPAKKPPTTPQEQAGYSIGMSVGQNLVTQGLDKDVIDPAMLARGIVDALTGADPALTDEQAMAAMQQIQQTMQARQQQMQAQAKVEGQQALAAGEAYLKANAQKQGVTVLPSGLQYKVLQEGEGESPAATDTVKVHYKGTLINGEQFDSSIDRGEPAEFPVNRVIPGWTEALQKMQVGDRWQLVIPAKLAYGEDGRPPVIPPNSVLVFEVELLEVQ